MEVKFFGANCLRIQTKNSTIVVDDYKNEKDRTITKAGDIALFTTGKIEKTDSAFVINQPGEYEINNISIQGIAARAHDDEQDKLSSTVYRLIINDFRIAIAGNIHPDLSESQLESIGTVDVLFVPVGGYGSTLDATGALKVIKKIGPSIIVPTHYADKKINYEVPQASLEDALKVLSLEPAEEIEELKLKTREFGEGTKLVILKNSL